MGLVQEHELHRRRRGRNIGLGVVLAAFVLLVYALTVAKVQNLPQRDSSGDAAAMEPAAGGGAAGGVEAGGAPEGGSE